MDSARPTFALCRHAAVDLSYTFRVGTREGHDRLPPGDLELLLEEPRSADVELGASIATVQERLAGLRSQYEPYVEALADHFELRMPQWMAPE